MFRHPLFESSTVAVSSCEGSARATDQGQHIRAETGAQLGLIDPFPHERGKGEQTQRPYGKVCATIYLTPQSPLHTRRGDLTAQRLPLSVNGEGVGG